MFTVQNVVGTSVSFTVTDTFPDSHTSSDTVSVDINSGPKFASTGKYFVVVPGKKVGESVYPGNPHYFSSLPIQAVFNRAYASSTRAVAYVQAQNSTRISPSPSITNSTEDFYWDTSTGMFTEILRRDNGVEVLHVTMSSTNLWQQDNPFDAFIVPAAIVTLTSAALLVVVMAAWYRKKKGRIIRTLTRQSPRKP